MPGAPTNDDSPIAAVDLGSNSFHLIIARVLGEQVTVLDRLRDPVRMAAELDDDGNLGDEAVQRLLASLQRFRERLGQLAPARVRAVGTDTFRRVERPADLLARASEALGFPIEVLAGGEEARLIYLGVAQEEPRIEGNRLVIDVGGGSTECILGKRSSPLLKDSLSMGCVGYTRTYFGEGKLTRKAFRKAEIAASLELEPLRSRYGAFGWEECVGSSGTLRALSEIVHANGWGDGPLELAGLKHVRRALIAAESVSNLELPGLSSERAPVIAGGLAIAKAAFESLGIQSMRPTRAALREGVLYDLLGRIRQEDVRDRTIRSLSERYHVDAEQAARVEKTALRCLEQVGPSWGLEPVASAQLLSWAARMHELGLALSHTGYHKHGAYVLMNSDMPGFSNQDQMRLAALVRWHRRRLTRNAFGEFPAAAGESLLRLCVLLRIAVRLHRSRSGPPLTGLRLETADDGLALHLEAGWLEERPLTSADLEDEDRLLTDSKIRLRLVPTDVTA